MCYPAFLSLMSQLVESNKACILIDSKQVFIEKLAHQDEWIFSVKLCEAEKEILSCFSSSGSFRFPQGNFSFKFESSTSSVFAIQRIQMGWKKYIPFKRALTYFLEGVSQYEEIFQPT